MLVGLGELQSALTETSVVSDQDAKLTPEQETAIRTELNEIQKEGLEAEKIVDALEETFKLGLEIEGASVALRRRRESLERLKAQAAALASQGMGEMLRLERDTGVAEDPFLHGFVSKFRKGIQRGLDKARQVAVGSVKIVAGKRIAAEADRTFSRAGGVARGDPEAFKKVYGKAGGAMLHGLRAMIVTVVTMEGTQLTVRLLLAKRKDRKKLRLKLKGAFQRTVSLVMMVASLASSIVTGPAGIALALAISALNAGVSVAYAVDAANQTKKAAKQARKTALAEIEKMDAEDRAIRAEIAKLKESIAAVRQKRTAALRTSQPTGQPGSIAVASATRDTTPIVVGGIALISGGLLAWHYFSPRPDAPDGV